MNYRGNSAASSGLAVGLVLGQLLRGVTCLVLWCGHRSYLDEDLYAYVPQRRTFHSPHLHLWEQAEMSILMMTFRCYAAERWFYKSGDVEVGKWDASLISSISDRNLEGHHRHIESVLQEMQDSRVNRRSRSVTAVRPCP